MSKLRREVLDSITETWLYLGNHMKRRPLQMVGLVLSLIILSATLFYSLDNSSTINDIEKGFCARKTDAITAEQREANCRRLVNQLLTVITPEQAEKLRKILEGGR